MPVGLGRKLRSKLNFRGGTPAIAIGTQYKEGSEYYSTWLFTPFPCSASLLEDVTQITQRAAVPKAPPGTGFRIPPGPMLILRELHDVPSDLPQL